MSWKAFRPSDVQAMQSAGALAAIEVELDRLEEHVSAAPDWAMSHRLLAEIAWVRSRLGSLRDTWGRKLVVAIVGPSGAGKSTLLNALAGRTLSPTGLDRPTTRQVIAYVQRKADARELVTSLGQDHVLVQTAQSAPELDHLILVDTPDTNTLSENQELLSQLLEHADLLLAVFPAQNPKLLDNIRFLERFVRQLPREAVVPVLNKVDRVTRDELESDVLPDFCRAIADSWEIEPQEPYLISARVHTANPGFVEDEQPLHELDQFAELRQFIFAALNKASQITDRRLAQAEHLLEVLYQDCHAILGESASIRHRVVDDLADLDNKAERRISQTLATQMKGSGTISLHAGLYGYLGQQWWGPVGWLVVVWGVLMRLGTFVGRLGRSQRPQLAVPRSDSLDAESAALTLSSRMDWSQALGQVFAENWPPIADGLVRCGFGASVRETAFWEQEIDRHSRMIRDRWLQVFEDRLARLAHRLSLWPIQLLFNLPTIGMVLWVCAQTILGFFMESYLSPDYFRHAGISILAIWLLSFILLQTTVALSLRHNLQRGASHLLAKSMPSLTGSLRSQLETLERLEHSCEVNLGPARRADQPQAPNATHSRSVRGQNLSAGQM